MSLNNYRSLVSDIKKLNMVAFKHSGLTHFMGKSGKQYRYEKGGFPYM